MRVQSWYVGEIRRLGMNPSLYGIYSHPRVQLSLFSVTVTHEGMIAFEGSITNQEKNNTCEES